MDIFARAKGLILRPAEEWRIIAAEPADTRGLFTSYAMPMSAIPAVAGFIGMAVFASILGGALGSTSLNADGVKALAALPSLDELRARLVGMIATPATRIAQIVNAPAASVARVIGAHARKDEAA